MARRLKLLELAEEERWTSTVIAKALIHSQHFQRQLLIVPRCTWTGHESDLLAVCNRSLRLIDIEIKISRQDLLADPKKDKWWESKWERQGRGWGEQRTTQREWPPKVWKHYYALPAAIWHKRSTELEAQLPKASGVLLMYRNHSGLAAVTLARRAKPNKDAEPIKPVDVMNLARLAGLRMWDALEKQENVA